MALFIKRKQTQETRIDRKTGEAYEVLRQVNWKSGELKELLEVNPSAFIEVPESHAAAVLRPQGQYQEVWLDLLQPPAPLPPAEDPATKPRSKSQRKRVEAQKGTDDGNNE